MLKASVGSLVESVALKGTLREAHWDEVKEEHYNLLIGTPLGAPDEMPADGTLWRIMGTMVPGAPNLPDGPTWEELLRIVSRIVGTKAATGGAYGAANEALKTFGSVSDKLYMLRSTAERRGINADSPFHIEEWLLLLTDRGVLVGGADHPGPTSWKPGLRSRVEQTLDILKVTRAAMNGDEIQFEDLVKAATKAEQAIDKDLSRGAPWAQAFLHAETGASVPAAPARGRRKVVVSVSHGTEAMNGYPNPPWYDPYAMVLQQATGQAILAPVG